MAKNKQNGRWPIGLVLVIAITSLVTGEASILLFALAIIAWRIIKFIKSKKRRNPGDPPKKTEKITKRRRVSQHSKERDDRVSLTLTRDEEGKEYRIPPAPTGMQRKVNWIPPEGSVTVAGIELNGGMIYVGTGSRSAQDHSEPALINPNLKVASINVDVSLPLLDYWPHYSTISEEGRKAYLQWLSTGRRDPNANIGYVFLFFYGLEHRVLIDGQVDASAKAETPAIETEIRALLNIYGHNNSFRHYASNFLSYILAGTIDETSYLHSPPTIAAYGGDDELPLLLSVGLGQRVADKRPIPPDWALAWALADPNIKRRTPVTRCTELFSELFKQEYTKIYGEGLRLNIKDTKLKVNYRSASAQLNQHDFSKTVGNLPDVSIEKTVISKLQALVDQCSTLLDPYSRYLGRNPDGANALDGLLQLPPALWPESVQAELENIKTRLRNGMLVMSLEALSLRLKNSGGLTRDKVLGVARVLERMGIGLEPDVLAGAKTPKPQDKIALFSVSPEDRSASPESAYSIAALTLDVACIAALRDGEISAPELRQISKHVDSWGHLSQGQRQRLKAHLRLGIDEPASLNSLKKKLGELPAAAKEAIAHFLAFLIQSDGKLATEEVKFLEGVYSMLGLDAQQVYSDLHVQALTDTTEPMSRVFRESTPSAGILLNEERIAKLQKETEAVSAMLANVFFDERIEDSVLPDTQKTEDEGASVLFGLDANHSTFLRQLISRNTWSREELSAIAGDMNLMLDGALEYINEAMLDMFEMPLAEGDDPVEINQEFLEKIPV